MIYKALPCAGFFVSSECPLLADSRRSQPGNHGSPSGRFRPKADIRSDGMDVPAYRFACALLAAREFDREAAKMICPEVKEGRIRLAQVIGALLVILHLNCYSLAAT
jgi:hypothetical protein